MQASLSFFKRGTPFFLIAACIFWGDVWFWLHQPLSWWLNRIPDDIFYYLKVARNLAQTGTSTFDGQTRTNGYHPGWMLLLSCISPLVQDNEEFLRVTLALSFALHFLSALILRWALSPLCGRLSSWLGAALWLLSPLPLRVAIQGMEGALYEVGLWTSVGYFLHFIAGKKEIAPRTALGFGAVLALAFWGRTEGILMAFTAIAMLIWLMRKRLRVPFLTDVAFLVCVAPWFLFSRFQTGSWGQQSGAMKMMWAASEASPHLGERLFSAFIFFCFWWVGPLTTLYSGLSPTFFLLGLLAVLFLFGILKAQRFQPLSLEYKQLFVWLSAFWLLSGSIYALFFSDARTWYWASPGVVLFSLSWGALSQLAKARPLQLRRFSPCLVGGAILVAFGFINWHFAHNVPAPYHLQSAAYEANSWVENYVPRTETLGVWNAGVPAYFSRYHVVNLDGLMNNEIVPYWKRHDFGAYLKEKKIRYLFDLPEAIGRVKPYCKTPLRLKVIARHSASQRVLWEVE